MRRHPWTPVIALGACVLVVWALFAVGHILRDRGPQPVATMAVIVIDPPTMTPTGTQVPTMTSTLVPEPVLVLPAASVSPTFTPVPPLILPEEKPTRPVATMNQKG